MHRATFLACRSAVRALPYRSVRTLGFLLGDLQYLLGGRVRRRMERELALLQGRHVGDRLTHRELRTAYRTSDAAVLEILKMFDRRQDPATLLSHVEVDGLDHLRAALDGGRGAIMLAGHMGNGALLVLQLVEAGFPVNVVYHQARMMDAELFERGLQAYGIEPIAANDGLKAYGRMLTALRRNQVVYIMADQGTKKARNGRVCRFLGKDMPMPTGPAQLARHAKAPVLPVSALAHSPRWKFAVRPVVQFEPGADLEGAMDALLAISEREILAHPELWSWHQRRWRHFPLAGVDQAP